MITFLQYVERENFVVENLSAKELQELHEFIGAINEDTLEEDNSFELGGKKYYAVFGKWYCDGKKISQDEYAEASKEYKKSFKKGSGKMYKDAEAAEKVTQKHFSNAAVAKNEVIKKLKSYGKYDDDGEEKYHLHSHIKEVEKAYKSLMYKAKLAKAVKKYIKDPSTLSGDEKKMVDREVKNWNVKPRKIVDDMEKEMNWAKKKFEKEVKDALWFAEKHEEEMKDEEGK